MVIKWRGINRPREHVLVRRMGRAIRTPAATLLCHLASFIDADRVVPVSVHEATVAVTKRPLAQSSLAGTRLLDYPWAFIEDGRAVVVAFVVVIVGLRGGASFCLG